MVLSKGLLAKTQFPSGYSVTVHDCIKGGNIYGFQVNNASPDSLACSGRSQPSGCYTIEFTFPDFDTVKHNKADVGQLTESAKVDTQIINPKLEALKTATFDYPLIDVVYSSVLVLLGVAFLIGRFGRFAKPAPGQNQNHAIIKESVPELAALGKFLFNVKGSACFWKAR